MVLLRVVSRRHGSGSRSIISDQKRIIPPLPRLLSQGGRVGRCIESEGAAEGEVVAVLRDGAGSCSECVGGLVEWVSGRTGDGDWVGAVDASIAFVRYGRGTRICACVVIPMSGRSEVCSRSA